MLSFPSFIVESSWADSEYLQNPEVPPLPYFFPDNIQWNDGISTSAPGLSTTPLLVLLPIDAYKISPLIKSLISLLIPLLGILLTISLNVPLSKSYFTIEFPLDIIK